MARLLPLILARWSPSPHPTAISGTEANFPIPPGPSTSQGRAWKHIACLTRKSSQEARVFLRLIRLKYPHFTDDNNHGKHLHGSYYVSGILRNRYYYPILQIKKQG